MNAMTPRRTVAETMARGQKSQDKGAPFLMLWMAWYRQKAAAIPPTGVRKKAGIKASPSPGPLHPCWKQYRAGETTKNT